MKKIVLSLIPLLFMSCHLMDISDVNISISNNTGRTMYSTYFADEYMGTLSNMDDTSFVNLRIAENGSCKLVFETENYETIELDIYTGRMDDDENYTITVSYSSVSKDYTYKVSKYMPKYSIYFTVNGTENKRFYNYSGFSLSDDESNYDCYLHENMLDSHFTNAIIIDIPLDVQSYTTFIYGIEGFDFRYYVNVNDSWHISSDTEADPFSLTITYFDLQRKILKGYFSGKLISYDTNTYTKKVISINCNGFEIPIQ